MPAAPPPPRARALPTSRLPTSPSAVSFNQAIGSTTPAFTALLAFLLFREKETARTYLSLVPVVSASLTSN